MKCPYCEKEMERGCVEQPRFTPLMWYPTSADMSLRERNKRTIKLTSFGGDMRVHYCAECKKFIIDQDELQA